MGKYKIVSFIPARGGSERLPRKNIKMMAGKPMLAWTIEASLKSKYINRTFVSTEDKEIKETVLKYGAEVIDRPVELSKGQIAIEYAYSHFKYCLWEEKYQPDYVITLISTSPLRTEEHIDEAFELYFKSESPLLMSVTKSRIIPTDTHIINESGKIERLLDKNTTRIINKVFRREHVESPIIYYFDGAIQIGPLEGVNYYPLVGIISSLDYVLPYIMEAKDTIDVDTELDFKIAEMLLEERIKGGIQNG